jgi:hypothetical protein
MIIETEGKITHKERDERTSTSAHLQTPFVGLSQLYTLAFARLPPHTNKSVLLRGTSYCDAVRVRGPDQKFLIKIYSISIHISIFGFLASVFIIMPDDGIAS